MRITRGNPRELSKDLMITWGTPQRAQGERIPHVRGSHAITRGKVPRQKGGSLRSHTRDHNERGGITKDHVGRVRTHKKEEKGKEGNTRGSNKEREGSRVRGRKRRRGGDTQGCNKRRRALIKKQ